MTTAIIPVVDLDRPSSVVSGELDEVGHESGFFQIVGHGLDDAMLTRTWSAVRAFFDLPLADRRSVQRPQPDYPFGYVAMAGETLSNSLGDGGLADLKETFNIGPVDSPRLPPNDPDEALLFSPNLWPSALPELRPALENYFREMDGLAQKMMGLFAVGLGLDAQFFADKIDRGTSALRALNYPDQATPPVPGQLRAGAHTDYGTLTILRQDNAPGGLEVLDHRTNSWVPVPSVPNAFVINVGDMLAQWTNDRWRSTLHRVVNPPSSPPGFSLSSRRQSMAFFHNANFNCEVACLPTCTSPDNPPRYAPVLAGPHLVSKFRRTT